MDTDMTNFYPKGQHVRNLATTVLQYKYLVNLTAKCHQPPQNKIIICTKQQSRSLPLVFFARVMIKSTNILHLYYATILWQLILFLGVGDGKTFYIILDNHGVFFLLIQLQALLFLQKQSCQEDYSQAPLTIQTFFTLPSTNVLMILNQNNT